MDNCLNRFRCQYQKGQSDYVSELVESKRPISSAQIIVALASLALKVRDKFGKKKGGKVALQVLRIHEYIIKNIHNTMGSGTGASKSYYLDKRNKNKQNRTERIDIEFYGEYGFEDKSHILNPYIIKYRETKGWFKNSNNATITN
ncbi:hypothetical protein AB9N12_18100 [Bacteroides sp. AN502(2024)]|uniref:hypothetical protein n=1 Tax=Bacteroides sp. AN502(2024) TaxID=3160599 RepID=UPI003512A0C8